jgi:ATP-binding cassette subfamily B protein/subfamily B ATP-binding cassette protein MsbA
MRQPASSRQRYLQFRAEYRRDRVSPWRLLAAGVPAIPAFSQLFRPRARGSLRKYLQLFRPYRRALAGIICFTVLAACLDLVMPLFMRYVVNSVLLDPHLVRTTRLTRFHIAGATFLSLSIVLNLLAVSREYRLRLLNLRVALTLRRLLFTRLLHLPLPTLWTMKAGGIITRLTGDVDTTVGLLQWAMITPCLSCLRIAVAMSMLLVLNVRLSLAAIAALPVVGIILLVWTRRIRPIYAAIRKDVEQIDGRVGESFAGIRVVRAFGREASEVREYIRGRHTLARKELFAHRRDIAVTMSWGMLAAAMNVAILWYGGYLTIVGRATIGDVMAFQWYILLLFGPISQLASAGSQLQRALAALDRVFQVLAMPHDKLDRPEALDAPRIVREIRFEHVEFEYVEGRPAVRDLSVTVPRGTVVALVGRSGAGKTTMTDLVARFHDPTRGRILVNGVDLRDLRLKTYRELLAIVPQEVFLFDGSVRDNIAYGRGDATDDEVLNAARRANAHEFIVKLPEGYDTVIGERGVKLSGGQCQRLAIARALLRSPQVLILDEATSSLDSESEQLIQASLSTLLAGRTTFVIAHRLSTIRRADVILLMDEGRIVERGTHDELMQHQSAYYRMVRRQLESTAELEMPLPVAP